MRHPWFLFLLFRWVDAAIPYGLADDAFQALMKIVPATDKDPIKLGIMRHC